MSFCMLYYVFLKQSYRKIFFLLCWEEGIFSNSDLIAFELSLKHTFQFVTDAFCSGTDIIFKLM